MFNQPRRAHMLTLVVLLAAAIAAMMFVGRCARQDRCISIFGNNTPPTDSLSVSTQKTCGSDSIQPDTLSEWVALMQ